VARSNKGCREVYRWVWYMLENEELYRSTSKETDGEWGTREAINISKLFLVAEKDAILVVCDRLSKITYFVAITEGYW